ncbi:kinase-associated lipoprotein B [Paenibacillus filicis]|uniref:Kinase-associated lipoprotein B n=1 Tax=Paenibacillus gyeongsangnamensis TaxID=3388067 RepID=A0ABT4QG81_9BACL|nr:kinase-associated lipoprotein B [Paenibacillus filicis]MCZ8515889.1 kinase-associated lipoprotein B [Paenibacillus filicis]
MQEQMFTVGMRVRASYKTGEYIGEIAEAPSAVKAAVQILAVVKHPTQGDLHNPMDPDVGFFHQRRALAYREIALMPLNTIRPYHGEVPDYTASLKEALASELELMDRTARWASRCKQELEQLTKEYSL